jgi:hypothetical protein
MSNKGAAADRPRDRRFLKRQCQARVSRLLSEAFGDGGESMARRSSTDLALVVLGLLAWVVAALFGAIPTTVDTAIAAGGGTAQAKAPSPSGAGAACGFAIAGGLCFLGAALASRPGGGKSEAEPGAAPDRGRM